jgi:DNA-binding LytR/AlgR family response regulator
MKDILRLLPAAFFLRIHRSYIVNFHHVERIDSEQVKIGDVHLPLGNKYKSEVLQAVKRKNRLV